MFVVKGMIIYKGCLCSNKKRNTIALGEMKIDERVFFYNEWYFFLLIINLQYKLYSVILLVSYFNITPQSIKEIFYQSIKFC